MAIGTTALAKRMEEHRPAGGAETVVWKAPTEVDEAQLIARSIREFHAFGYRYRDVAVLVRGSSSYEDLLNALEAERIPVQPGGRTGLFQEPEAQLFGRTFAFLAGTEWRATGFSEGEEDTIDTLVAGYRATFGLDDASARLVRRRLKTILEILGSDAVVLVALAPRSG